MSLIDDIPSSWATTELGEIIDYGKTEKVEPTKIPPDSWVLELEDVEKDTSKIFKRLAFAERKSKSTKNRFQKGDVLYGKLRPYLNKVVLADRNGYCSTEIVPLKPNQGIRARYLLYWLKHPTFLNYVNTVSHGINMPRLGTEAGRQAPLVLAPFNEQKRIADKLDTLLARVDVCGERLDRVQLILKRFRQSVLSAATTGQLTEGWRDNTSVDDWTSSKLSDFGTVSGGVTKNSGRTGLALQVKYITVANVYENDLKLNGVGTIGVTAAELSRSLLQNNDLLFVEGNGSIDQIGRVALWNGAIDPCVHQNHIIKFRAGVRLNPKYALFWMMSPSGRDSLMEAAVSTAGLYNLSISKIERIEIIVPPANEQAEIVRRVETLFAFADRLEARLEAARSRIERFTPATLAKAFRGELVPQDPDDEPASVLLERIQAARQSRVSISSTSIKRKLRSQIETDKKLEVTMYELSKIQPNHLTNLLRGKGRVTAKALYRIAQLTIEDFYEQLRSEEGKGFLREVREGNESYLEAT